MSEVKHTPGPWTIGPDEPSLKSIGKLQTYEIGGRDSAVWCAQVSADEFGEANARLVAAAPEMLEALETLFDITPFATNDKDAEIRLWVRKVIRKAKGE